MVGVLSAAVKKNKMAWASFRWKFSDHPPWFRTNARKPAGEFSPNKPIRHSTTTFLLHSSLPETLAKHPSRTRVRRSWRALR